jgi:hypothetical protein
LSAADKASLPAFTPLQVVKSDETLGDQISRAMRVSFQQKTYFLLKDGQGKLISSGSQGYSRLLKGCTVLNDSVEVIREAGIRLEMPSSSSPADITVRRGETITVLFQSNDRYYVQTSGLRPRHGWCALASRSAWRKSEETRILPAAHATLTPELKARLIECIASANRAYQTYFERFNQTTGQQKTAPVWRQASASGNELRWSLSSPYNRSDELNASTRYLVQNLQDLLIGKPFTVTQADGDITVTAKP